MLEEAGEDEVAALAPPEDPSSSRIKARRLSTDNVTRADDLQVVGTTAGGAAEEPEVAVTTTVDEELAAVDMGMNEDPSSCRQEKGLAEQDEVQAESAAAMKQLWTETNY